MKITAERKLQECVSWSQRGKAVKNMMDSYLWTILTLSNEKAKSLLDFPDLLLLLLSDRNLLLALRAPLTRGQIIRQ